MKKVDPLNYLEQGATTIMLRNLPRAWTVETILKKMDAFAGPGEYDFINMPWDYTRGTNIALCFVNFMSHEEAKRAFSHLVGISLSNPWSPRAAPCVSQSAIQGFQSNLAYYIASINRSTSNDPHAPWVFKNGVRIDVNEAIEEHVTREHIQLALEVAHRIRGVSKHTCADVPYKIPRQAKKSDNVCEESAGQLKAGNKAKPKASAKKNRKKERNQVASKPWPTDTSAISTAPPWNDSPSEVRFPKEHRFGGATQCLPGDVSTGRLQGMEQGSPQWSGARRPSLLQAASDYSQQPVASHAVMASELAQISQSKDVKLASAVVYRL